MREQQAGATTHEFVTEVLDESSWATVLSAIIEFLRERSVRSLAAQFGFVLARDLRGEKTPENCTVSLDGLEALIQRGIQDGTIEWGGSSDFRLSPVGLPMDILLCNDGDLHFSSPDSDLLLTLTQRLTARGVRVYDSGNLVETDRLAKANPGNAIGRIGVVLLALAWVSACSTRWLPSALRFSLSGVAPLAALISLVLAITSARKHSKWWYLLAAASLVSGLVLLADLLVGD
jgi:hypothetical protein